MSLYPQMFVTNLLEIETLWLFNIAMEHGPFIDSLPIKNGYLPVGYVK